MRKQECKVLLIEVAINKLTDLDSAASGMIGRDVQTQAYLALRGKVKNVEKCGGVKGALDNNEIRSMIHAFGCGVGDTFDVTKLRYGKIIIMTDADPDGAHIRALLLTFLYRLSPELFSEGKIYVCVSPLHKITVGKETTFYISSEEFEKASNDLKARGKSFTPQRFKGLGEMMPADLKETCLKKENRKLIKVTVENAMTAEEVLRKLMASDEVGARKIFFKSNGDII